MKWCTLAIFAARMISPSVASHTGGSHDSNHLPAFYIGVQPLDQGLFCCVGEMYVIKDYISLNMLRRRDTMVILCFLLLI